MTDFTAKFNATVDEITKAFLGGKIDKATAEKRFADALKLKESEEAAKVKAEEQKAREIKLTKVAKEAAYALTDYITVLVEDISPVDPKDRAEMTNVIFEALMEFKNPIEGAKNLKESLDKIEKESTRNETDLESLTSLVEMIREFEKMGDPSKLSEEEIEKKLNKVFGGKATGTVPVRETTFPKTNRKIRDNEKIFEDFFKNL